MIADPGYKQFVIDPIIPKTINYADAEIQSPYGLIKNNWRKEGDSFSMKLSIPFNTSAILPLTAAKAGTVKVNGTEWKKDTFAPSPMDSLTLGSGVYTVSFEL